MPLICTFGPKADESSLGYYRRLATRNALFSWKELARFADLSPQRSSLFNQPEYIAQVLGLNPLWTEAARDKELHIKTVWKGLHRSLHDAVCPECLKEDLYLRTSWEHAYVTACSRHKCLLLDRCPACNNKLSILREHIELCRCGADLRTQNTKTAEPVALWVTDLLLNQQHSKNHLSPSLAGASITHAAELVKVLSQPIEQKNFNVSNPSTVSETLAFLGPLKTILQCWPNSFEEHVRARLNQADPSARTLSKALGTWYARLNKACEDPALKPVLDIVLNTCAQHFDGLMSDDAARGRNAKHLLLLGEAASSIGISRDRLRKAILCGEMSAQAKRFGPTGTTYLIAQEDVDQLRICRSAWISKLEACSMLQIPESVLEHLVDAGVLIHDKHWASTIQKSGPVEKVSVESFAQAIKQHIRRVATDEPTVFLCDINSRKVGDKAALRSTLKAIQTGQLRAIRLDKSIGKTAFLVKDVQAFFSAPETDHGMTIQDLSKATGWKWESISHWIAQGLLESTPAVRRGQKCTLISQEQLIKFRKTYIPLSDLAQALDTRPSVLRDRFEGIELVGAKLVSSNVKRGALIRLKDLGYWAALGIASDRSLFATKQA